MTKSAIQTLFQDFEVANIRLILSKGFGFVTLATPEQVERAIVDVNGRSIDGSGPLRICRARRATTVMSTLFH